MILNLTWKLVSDVVRDIVTVKAVAVADGKEVQALDLAEVRCENETVLVLLVRVAWNEAHRRCESELRYHVVPLGCSLILLGRCLRFLFFILLVSSTIGGLSKSVVRGIHTPVLSGQTPALVDRRVRLMSKVVRSLSSCDCEPVFLGGSQYGHDALRTHWRDLAILPEFDYVGCLAAHIVWRHRIVTRLHIVVAQPAYLTVVVHYLSFAGLFVGSSCLELCAKI